MKSTIVFLAAMVCLLMFRSLSEGKHVRTPYTVYHENGTRKFSVEYKKNRLTGQWQSWYPSGMSCDSGRFSGNVPDGEWKGWHADGSLRYIWHTSSAKLNSLKEELVRQPKTKFFLIAQKPITEAVRYYQTDYLFHAHDAKQKGYTRSQLLHKKTDLTLIEQTVNRNTLVREADYIPPFAEMLLHGEFQRFHPGGALKERGIYLNGLRDGVWEEFAISGEMSRGTYQHGIRSGEWRRYDKEGKLVSYTHYKQNGEVSESFQFNK